MYERYAKMCELWFDIYAVRLFACKPKDLDFYLRSSSALIVEGVDINVSDATGYTGYCQGTTALHLACLLPEPKRMKVLRHLIGLSANPNVQDVRKNTPAHWLATDFDCDEAMTYLHAAGANLYARNVVGASPDAHAVSDRTKEIVVRLRNGFRRVVL